MVRQAECASLCQGQGMPTYRCSRNRIARACYANGVHTVRDTISTETCRLSADVAPSKLLGEGKSLPNRPACHIVSLATIIQLAYVGVRSVRLGLASRPFHTKLTTAAISADNLQDVSVCSRTTAVVVRAHAQTAFCVLCSRDSLIRPHGNEVVRMPIERESRAFGEGYLCSTLRHASYGIA